MALETDSLDLYLRMAGVLASAESQQVFRGLAEEEKEHLRQLGKLRGERSKE
jgi:rubrerythrin